MKTQGLLKLAILFMAVLPAMAACGKARPGGTVSIKSPDFFGIGEDLAFQLAANIVGHDTPRVIMTSVVDIDDLYATSGFGRTLTESLATRLFHRGFTVVEVRKSTELLVKDKAGELILTRDAARLAAELPATAVVVGTYSLTPTTVIVNIRLIDAASQDVLSVAGMELQRTRNINYLLAEAHGLADGELSVYE